MPDPILTKIRPQHEIRNWDYVSKLLELSGTGSEVINRDGDGNVTSIVTALSGGETRTTTISRDVSGNIDVVDMQLTVSGKHWHYVIERNADGSVHQVIETLIA